MAEQWIDVVEGEEELAPTITAQPSNVDDEWSDVDVSYTEEPSIVQSETIPEPAPAVEEAEFKPVDLINPASPLSIPNIAVGMAHDTIESAVDLYDSYTNPTSPSVIADRVKAYHSSGEFNNLIYSEEGKNTRDKIKSDLEAALGKYDIGVTEVTMADGSTQKMFTMPDGTTKPYTSSVLRDIFNAKLEVAGSLGGAIAGAKVGSKVPGPLKGPATIAGGIIGGFGGAGLGADADKLINSFEVTESFEEADYLSTFNRAGTEDALFGLAGAGVVNIAGRIMNKTKHTLQYLQDYLQLDKKQAQELIDAYGLDYKQGAKVIEERIVELAELGGPDGRAFLKTALADDSDLGRQAANNYLQQTTHRADIVMDKARETNEPLYQLLFDKRIGEGEYGYIDWKAVQKELEKDIQKGGTKYNITETEATMFDNLATRYSDMDKELFKVASNRNIPTHYSASTGQQNLIASSLVQANKVIFGKLLDNLSPTYRHNQAVVEAIQTAVSRSTDPTATLKTIGKSNGDAGRLARELLYQNSKQATKGIEPKQAELGGQATPVQQVTRTPMGEAPTGQTGYPTPKEEVDPAKIKAQQKLEEEQMLQKVRDADAEAKMALKEQERIAKEEGETLLAGVKEADAEARMAINEADETRKALDAQKAEIMAKNEANARTTYKARQHDLKKIHKEEQELLKQEQHDELLSTPAPQRKAIEAKHTKDKEELLVAQSKEVGQLQPKKQGEMGIDIEEPAPLEKSSDKGVSAQTRARAETGKMSSWKDEAVKGTREKITYGQVYAKLEGAGYSKENAQNMVSTLWEQKTKKAMLDRAKLLGIDDLVEELLTTPKKGMKSPKTLDPTKIQDYIGDRVGAKHGALDKALKNVEGDYEGPAIRGMVDNGLAKLEVGDSYKTRGVTSIAKNKKTADQFADEEYQGKKGPKVYVTFDSFKNKPVNLGEGNKIGFEDGIKPRTAEAKGSYWEDEVIIPSGRDFEVVSKEVKNGEVHLTVKEK